MNFFKRIFCKHIYIETITNLYGEAAQRYKARRVSRCRNCGKIIYLNDLDSACNKINEI